MLSSRDRIIVSVACQGNSCSVITFRAVVCKPAARPNVYVVREIKVFNHMLQGGKGKASTTT